MNKAMQTTSAGYANPYIVASQSVDVRAAFIRKTYVHVALAIVAFAALESLLLQIPGVPELAMKMTGGWNWLIVLGAFMAVSWIADKWANSATSLGMQYAGLGLYVVAEAIIFLPLLVIANFYATQIGGPYAGIIGKAAFFTLLLVAGLTAIVFTTKKDFSFIGGFLFAGILVAFVAGIAAMIFSMPGLSLAVSAMFVLLMCGLILYQTSQIVNGGETNYILATTTLYVSIYNLFTSLLHLLAAFSGND